MATERPARFGVFHLLPLARFLLEAGDAVRLGEIRRPRVDWIPSSVRILLSAAATCFLPGSERRLAWQFSAQLWQPGMQSKGRATTGMPVLGSQSNTPAGQKLRHSRSRRHILQLNVGNHGNCILRLRSVDTVSSPKSMGNRTGCPCEAVNGAVLWAEHVRLSFHAAGPKSPHFRRRGYPPAQSGSG